MRWPWNRVAADADTALAELTAQTRVRYEGLRSAVHRQSGQLKRLSKRIDDLTPVRHPVELDLEERQRMQAGWPNVSCVYCGMAHGGTCTRVRRIELDPARGVPVRVWFWRRWTPPPDALSVEDVFGTPGPRSTTNARGETNG